MIELGSQIQADWFVLFYDYFLDTCMDCPRERAGFFLEVFRPHRGCGLSLGQFERLLI